MKIDFDNINPKNQKEADDIYKELESFMCDEAIYQDGEASTQEANETFDYYLNYVCFVASLGYRPTFESDVFYPIGNIPLKRGKHEN